MRVCACACVCACVSVRGNQNVEYVHQLYQCTGANVLAVCVCTPVHPSRSLDMNSCIFVREGTAQDVLTKHPPERNSHGLAAGTQVHGTNESPRSL